VVPAAKALGITFSNDFAATADQPVTSQAVDWTAQLQAVAHTFLKVERMYLSAFGRAFACSGYGISRILYHAEYGGMPPADVLNDLQRMTRLMIDRGHVPKNLRGESRAPPTMQHQPPSSLTDDIIVGHPKEGGCGAMPWQQHIRARHAVWALRLLNAWQRPAQLQPLWAATLRVETDRLQRERVAGSNIADHPAYMLLCSLRLDALGGMVSELPPPLRRMVEGLRALFATCGGH
jgi:hypothetical protein